MLRAKRIRRKPALPDHKEEQNPIQARSEQAEEVSVSPAAALTMLNQPMAGAQRLALAQSIGQQYGNKQLQRVISQRSKNVLQRACKCEQKENEEEVQRAPSDTSDAAETGIKVEGPCENTVARPHPLIVKGSVHPAVREAQGKLNLYNEKNGGALGEPLVSDCIFGNKTANAVVAFQKQVFPDNPKEWDGKVGNKTWAEMDKIEGQTSTPPITNTPPLPTTSNDIRTVKLWLNAFIPRDVPGVTTTVPAGPHAGETMISGPIPGVSDCFLTDNRDFDNNIGISSRMHSEIEIDVSGPSEVFQFHKCSQSTELDCEDGDSECEDYGNTSRMGFANLRGSANKLIHVDLVGAANNPCVTGSPDIDYIGTITIDVTARTVTFNGLIDQFPAFEMYATANGGAGAKMFQTPPLPGKDPWNLVGAANRPQTGNTSI